MTNVPPIAQVAGKGVQLKPNLVVSETVAGKPRPVDRVLAFLDVLLRRVTADVELRHPLGGPRQVGHARQQMGDALLQDRVSRETDGVDVTFRFQELVDLRLGKGGVAPVVAANIPGAIAPDNRPKNQLPGFGAVSVAKM